MSRADLLQGLKLAVIAGFTAVLLTLSLPFIFNAHLVNASIIALVSLVYLLHLLKRARLRQGRLVFLLIWLGINTLSWILESSLVYPILDNAILIWIVRSLYFHNSIRAALLDLGLVILGLCAAAWALLQTASLVVAIWCFFLLQIFFSLIKSGELPTWLGGQPDSRLHSSTEQYGGEPDRFAIAHRVACSAISQLSNFPKRGL